MAKSLVDDNSGSAVSCPVCGLVVAELSFLCSHLVEQAEASEERHVMWLNRHITKRRMSPDSLEPLLASFLAGEGSGSEVVKR